MTGHHALTAPTGLTLYVGKLRGAIDASGRLRVPGGDVLDRLLSDLQSGKTDGAADALGPLLDNSTLSDVAHFITALLLDADDRREDAEAALASIVSSGESPYDTLCLTGDLYMDWRKPIAAQRAFGQAIALAPHASHAHLRRGKA